MVARHGNISKFMQFNQPTTRRLVISAFALHLMALAASAGESALVGRVVEIKDQLLPGAELKVRPSQGLRDPLVLRITATYPHGTAGFRYDFSCIPMQAGKYDLTKFLELTTNQPAKDLPPLMIEATGVLPEGPPSFLTEAPATSLSKSGGYKALIPYGIAAWALLGVIGLVLFRKKKLAAAAESSLPPPSLAKRLKPLLERALTQSLATPEKAELERLLLGYGRERLGLTKASDPIVWQALRDNAATSSWLHTLEGWLHRPSTSPPSQNELQELLALINSSSD